MTLNFPNRSRFFDSTRRAVRFWGHDTAMEASSFVTEDAPKQLEPDRRFDEMRTAEAFDTNRESPLPSQPLAAALAIASSTAAAQAVAKL